MATVAAGRAARDGAERFTDEEPVTGTSGAARRYAKAIFELAQEEGNLERWSGRLEQVRALFSDPDVAAVLTNPTIATERREQLVSQTGAFDDEATNLARLLIESARIEEIAAIEDEFQRLADESAGRVRATVTTAIELEAQERDRVARELSRRLEKDVRMTVIVDPKILGGLKLQYGDRVIDATVATRLEQLRRRLAAS